MSWVHHFGEILRIPIVEAVAFRLRGLCTLGTFLLPTFTRLGHECQDRLSPMRWNAYAHKLDPGLYSHPKEFWGNGARTHVNSKGIVCLFVCCLTSQQQASVSQGRICSDIFTCCHTEIEAADQTFYLTQSQHTDTWPTSPSADPITPGA